MPITDGGTIVPVDSAATKVWGLYDGTNLWLPRRATGIGWHTGARIATVSASVTRPADTNAYATGDAVTNSVTVPVALTFSNVAALTGGSFLIVDALLIDSANVAIKGVFELWLFKDSPTPDNDNALFTPTDAECEGLIGIIDFTTARVGDAGTGAAGNAVYHSPGLNIEGWTDGDANCYGLLVVRNAYVPVASEKFTIVLKVAQD